MSLETKIPVWFWVAAVLLLAWNLLGLSAFIFDPVYGAGDMTQFTESEQAKYTSRPIWAYFGFAAATVGGSLGSLMLILKKARATTFFWISLIGLVIQNSWFIVDNDIRATLSPMIWGVQTFILLTIVFGIWLSRSSTLKGWLN